MLNVPVPEVILNQPGVRALIGKREAARRAVAFAVDAAGGFDHLCDQGSRERQQEKHCK